MAGINSAFKNHDSLFSRLVASRGRRKSRVMGFAMPCVVETLESRILFSYTLKTLASFDATSTGFLPYSGVVADANGNLYGTLASGGPNGNPYGTLFEYVAKTKVLTTLVEFDGSNGRNPDSSLIIDSQGDIFGATSGGGDLTQYNGTGAGTIFEFETATQNFTTLVKFNKTDGAGPYGDLIEDKDGNVYGTTGGGGTSDSGTIYKIAAGTHTLSTLTNFDGTNESDCSVLVMDAHGNLFGSSIDAGKNSEGVVFEVAAGTHTPTTLVNFDSTTGENPGYGGMTIDSVGNLFGTTATAGPDGYGTVYEIFAATHRLTTLASFNGTNGGDPGGRLLQDSKGNLYGTMQDGGTSQVFSLLPPGGVFELVAGAHAVTDLFLFNGTNGGSPQGGVISDIKGNLYGTAGGGGTFKYGTVFELSPPAIATAKLGFSTQPSSGTAGTDLGTVVVEIENSANQVITTDNSTITINVGTGPGTLNVSVAAKNGIATFSNDLILNKAGTYTLIAKDGTDSSVTSGSFKISPAAASKLVFATVPVGTTPGKNLASFKVDVEDKFGNIVTNNTSSVTLATKTGPGAIFGTSAVNAVAGVATFSAVNFHLAGAYTIGATDTGLTSATSGSFKITAAAVAHLAFVQNPTNVVAGVNIAPGITVKVTDAFGNVIAGASVKLAIGSGPVGGALFGTVTATTAATGIATFSTVSLHIAGSYTLTASVGAIVSPKSTAFTVSAAKASKLVFTTLPVGAKHGVAFTVKVSVEDAFGNVLIADNTGTITLALATHPTGSTLGGTLTVNVVKGVATFSNLTVNLAGSYSFKASDSFAVAAATSAAIVAS